MGDPSSWPWSRLLLALPSGLLKRLTPELERIHCDREQSLIDADSVLDHVFFPDSGVISVVAVYADGSIIEMATIGREGCTGEAIFGAKSSSARFFVQIPGSAARMSRSAFTRAMRSMPAFRNLMNAYVHAFLEQLMISRIAIGCLPYLGNGRTPSTHLPSKYMKATKATTTSAQLNIVSLNKRIRPPGA